MLDQFNSTTSGNANGKRKIKRMEFTFKDQSYKFALNPEEYTQTEPLRVTMTQTKGGAWLDTWGAGIVEISIKGTTGITGGTGTDIDVGYRRFKELRNLIRSVYDNISDGSEVTDLLGFYNYTDNEYYWCYPKSDGIELYRSKSRPHIYQYSISLYALRRIGEAVTTSATLGNPNKTSNSTESSGSTTNSQSSAQYTGGVAEPVDYDKFSTSQTDKTTKTIVRSKANVDLVSDAIDYCGRLEPIMGGKNGKLCPVTAWQCTNGLDIASTGTVVNVPSITLADITTDESWLYNSVVFNSAMSIDTYEMTRAIKNYDVDYLSTEFMTLFGSTQKERIVASVASGTNYSSTLFENAQNCRTKSYISKSDFARIKIILLESMRVYYEIYKIADTNDYSGQLSADLTVNQMNDIIDNIEALILYLKFTESDYNQLYRIDLLSDLRHLEKIMTQINTDIVLYL